MSIHLHRDLESLEQHLLAQAAIVEQMTLRASMALRERRIDLLEKLWSDEQMVNYREVEIEEECLKLLALHQPVAVDLRRVATVLKINGDLERIADLAVNIGERAKSLSLTPEFRYPEDLNTMVEVSLKMVRDALESFVQLNVEMAQAVCLQDDVVDDLNRQCINVLQQHIVDNPGDSEPALQYFSASRHIERIADHATNIAEDVIYLVNGEIARHHEGKPF